jgi:hypothetical protein
VSEAVEFRVVRTKADYVRAVALHAMLSPWTLRQFLASPIIVAILPFVFAADEPLDARIILSVTFFFVALLLLIIALAPCYYWAARSGWRSPGALQPIDYSFDAAGMRVKSAAGSGEIAWISFNGAFEDARLFLFRQHPGMLQIIPKRDVQPEMLVRLRVLAREHVRGPLKIQTGSVP